MARKYDRSNGERLKSNSDATQSPYHTFDIMHRVVAGGVIHSELCPWIFRAIDEQDIRTLQNLFLNDSMCVDLLSTTHLKSLPAITSIDLVNVVEHLRFTDVEEAHARLNTITVIAVVIIRNYKCEIMTTHSMLTLSRNAPICDTLPVTK